VGNRPIFTGEEEEGGSWVGGGTQLVKESRDKTFLRFGFDK